MGAKREREAVALLADLRRRPLDARLEARPGANVPHDITPSALMIRLCAALCDRARAAARDGDAAAATGWTREARALATHVLASSAVTFDTLRTVRAMDQAIGRTAVRVEEETGSSGAAVRLAAREARLRAFYEECVWPDLVNARRERDAAQNAVLLSVAPGGAQEQARRRINREMDAREPDLAAVLRQRYLSARTVLLSPLPLPETHVVRRQGPRPTVRPRA